MISRKKWTNIGITRRVDVDQAGISDGSQEYNSAIFAITSIVAKLSRINLTEENKIYFLFDFNQKQPNAGQQ